MKVFIAKIMIIRGKVVDGDGNLPSKLDVDIQQSSVRFGC